MLDEYVEVMTEEGKYSSQLDRDAMEEYVHTSGGEIIKHKGATYYAVSVSVCRLCRMLLASQDSINTVSSMMHGEYGLNDICLSTLTIIGPEGVKGKMPVRLTNEELIKLQASADKLRETMRHIKI